MTDENLLNVKINYVNPLPGIREFAKEGLFSEYTLRLMLKQGKLPHIMCGNRCRINRALFMKQIDEESKKAVKHIDR